VVEQLQDRRAAGDFVIEHDDVPASDITDDRGDDDLVVSHALLSCHGDGHFEQTRERAGFLRVAQIWR
jgi:hypothetical protein